MMCCRWNRRPSPDRSDTQLWAPSTEGHRQFADISCEPFTALWAVSNHHYNKSVEANDLAAVFLACAPPPPTPADPADESALDAALRAALDAARAAWPQLDLADEVFVRHLAQRAAAATAAAVAQLRPADLYLACGCLHGVPRALAALDAQILSQVPLFLGGRADPATTDEVTQRVRELLLVGRDGALPKIAEFSGRGALVGWVRVVATRTALNLRRNMDDKLAGIEGPDLGGLQHQGTSPELQVLQARAGAAFKAAFADALASLPDEQRVLLHLHLIKGLNVDRLGILLQVSRATASRRVIAARDEVAARTRKLLQQRLKLSPQELDSLAGALHSQLDMSISRCLRDDSR